MANYMDLQWLHTGFAIFAVISSLFYYQPPLGEINIETKKICLPGKLIILDVPEFQFLIPISIRKQEKERTFQEAPLVIPVMLVGCLK